MEKDTYLHVEKNATVTFGQNVFLNRSGIASELSMSIGDNVMIADAVITDNDWHGLDGNPAVRKLIKIGNHVWIGMKAIILKGVSVGDNSVISATSIITKNVEANTVVAGNPAKKVRATKGFMITN